MASFYYILNNLFENHKSFENEVYEWRKNRLLKFHQQFINNPMLFF